MVMSKNTESKLSTSYLLLNEKKKKLNGFSTGQWI